MLRRMLIAVKTRVSTVKPSVPPVAPCMKPSPTTAAIQTKLKNPPALSTSQRLAMMDDDTIDPLIHPLSLHPLNHMSIHPLNLNNILGRDRFGSFESVSQSRETFFSNDQHESDTYKGPSSNSSSSSDDSDTSDYSSAGYSCGGSSDDD